MMQQYAEYKDSGVDWLGEIPAGWEISKLGSCLSPFSEKNYPDLPLLSITRKLGVIERDIENQDTNHNYIPDDLSGYKLLKKGQFGMNKMKAWQGSYGVSPFTGIVSPAYYMFDFIKDIDPDFFHVAIRSKLYVSFFGSASDGVRIGQWDLSKSRMKEIPLALPPLPEQTAIANFLDDKAAKIETLVGIKRRQIEFLGERKQILIQNAVTKGLNSDATMKDSCVDWIGDIPAHWEVKRLASFGAFSKGGGFSKSDLADTGTDAVLYGDIYTKYNFTIDRAVRTISPKVADKSVWIKQGDLLFTGSGETKEDIGKCVLYRGSARTVAGGDVILFHQAKNHPLFLSFCLNSNGVVEQKAKSSKGEIIVHTYASKLKNMFIPIPPIDEQEEIADFVWQGVGEINAAITIKQNQITKLSEYKTTLINAAVTGKIKVT